MTGAYTASVPATFCIRYRNDGSNRGIIGQQAKPGAWYLKGLGMNDIPLALPPARMALLHMRNVKSSAWVSHSYHLASADVLLSVAWDAHSLVWPEQKGEKQRDHKDHDVCN